MTLDHVHILKEGGVGVMPTDTLYGLVGRALNQIAVDRIYGLKQRAPEKPFIILVGSIGELAQFGVEFDEALNQFLDKEWPGPTSIILPITADQFGYLDRGTKTLAFRLPNDPDLVKLLQLTGPLAAPSANPEGQPPATTIDQARGYFDTQIDFYVDGGERNAKPSRLVRYDHGEIEVLRP